MIEQKLSDEISVDNSGNSENKTCIISVRIDDETRIFIESMSEKSGLTKSEFLRFLVAERINNFIDCTRYTDKETEREMKAALYFAANTMSEYKTALHEIEYQLRKIGVNFNQELKKLDEFSDIKDYPILPAETIDNLIEELKKITFYCNQEFEIYGEVLRCLLPS